jgi:uncharacterized protein YndB with AHSA1/START domain
MTTQTPYRVERTYQATLEEVWALWTTKDGFESWWGPEGFRVNVNEFDLREGGTLDYDMIAVGEAQIAYMLQQGSPVSHGTHGKFRNIEKHRRLELVHVIDFIPDLEAYENTMLVEFFEDGPNVRMVVTIQPHSTEEWSRMSAMGFESQLEKLPHALEARRAAS